MPKADTEHTPIDPYEGWPIGALEPVIFDLRASIGILGHLITARDEVQIDEWQKCEGDLITAMMRIHDLWGQVWDQRIAEKRAHEEALAALEAKKAAPGSPQKISGPPRSPGRCCAPRRRSLPIGARKPATRSSGGSGTKGNGHEEALGSRAALM
jgi:hypothetical protein